MLERGCISNAQFMMMLVLIILGTAVLFEPSLSVALGGKDAWLAPILAGIIGILVLLTMIQLNKLFPGQTPIQYMQSLFGKWVGSIAGFYLIWFMLRFLSIMVREFTDFTVTVTLTSTPPLVILFLMFAVVFYGVRKGLEVIARVSEFVVIVELIQLVVSIVVFASKDIDFEKLLPLFENGPVPLLRSSLFTSVWFSEVVLAGFLLPYIRVKQGTTKSGLLAVCYAVLLLVIPNIFTLGIFGDLITPRLHFGLYEVARYVSIANFFERIDPVTMGVWITMIYCKLAIYCYVISLGLAQLLRLKDYRPVVGVVCVASGVMSLQAFGSQADMVSYLRTLAPVYGNIMGFLFPVIVLGFAYIRKRLKKPNLSG